MLIVNKIAATIVESTALSSETNTTEIRQSDLLTTGLNQISTPLED
ncbi:hypothetical protein LF1_36490 [Rubripirellula obstinata]|uniref:Uncharacterized protein n=1 Tax=Rubripirellula obstinata TaxID=406547 RepID=A0A5B1CMH5_9BACT|nr:hypothetical protein LF1_36490 [Rubripirellula obstinata]